MMPYAKQAYLEVQHLQYDFQGEMGQSQQELSHNVAEGNKDHLKNIMYTAIVRRGGSSGLQALSNSLLVSEKDLCSFSTLQGLRESLGSAQPSTPLLSL